MRKFAVGVLVGILNVPALFFSSASAEREVAPAAIPVDSAVPSLAEMALGLTGGFLLGDLAGGLPAVGETASVLPVLGGAGAEDLLGGVGVLGVLGGGGVLGVLGGGDVLGVLGAGGAGGCQLPTGDALGTVNGTLGSVTGVTSGLPLLGSVLGQTTGGGLLGSAVATVNSLVGSAPVVGEIAAQVTC